MEPRPRRALRRMSKFSYRGIPQTPEEWAALEKIASGHPALSRDELRRLFMLGLVQRELGRVCLSEHGRLTLGSSRAYPAAAVGAGQDAASL